jgi:hypothetical protein
LTEEELAEIEAEADPEWLESMNARFAFIHDRPGVILDTRGTETAIVGVLKLSEFHNMHANKFLIVPGGQNRKAPSISKLWFAHPRRREYRTAGDYPTGKKPRGALNLWTGLAVAPKPGKWPTINEFLWQIICAGESSHYAYLRDLLFWKIQNPTENPEVAILLHGQVGVGKGTLHYLLKRLFGPKRVQQFIRSEDATAKFNADIEGKVVLFYDEALFGHDPRLRSRLKGEITEPQLPIEPKGINRYYVRNMALRLFASNEAAPIPIDLNDRRLFALAVSNTHAEDYAYFTKLRAAIDADELKAFVEDALAADLSAFEAIRRTPPKTKARAELALSTAKPEHEYLFELLSKGGPLETHWKIILPRQRKPGNHSWRNGKIVVERNAVHEDYCEWLRRRRQHRRSPINSTEFRRAMQDILDAALFRSAPVKRLNSRETYRALQIGSLRDCRAAFDAHTKYAHAWDDTVSGETDFVVEDEDEDVV